MSTTPFLQQAGARATLAKDHEHFTALRATVRSSKSAVPGYGQAEVKLGARAAGDTSEAA
jgi:hypothetical protein